MSLREFNFKSNNTQKGAHSLTDRPERIQTCTYTHVGISCKRGVICELGNEHLTSVLWGLYAHTCWVLNKTVPVVINIIFSFKDSEVILEAFIYLLTSWQQSTKEMLWQMKGFVLVALKAGGDDFQNPACFCCFLQHHRVIQELWEGCKPRDLFLGTCWTN